MTASEAYASLLNLYKQMMFPPPTHLPGGGQINRTGWTMTQIDELDARFFYEMLGNESSPVETQQEVYLNDVW